MDKWEKKLPRNTKAKLDEKVRKRDKNKNKW